MLEDIKVWVRRVESETPRYYITRRFVSDMTGDAILASLGTLDGMAFEPPATEGDLVAEIIENFDALEYRFMGLPTNVYLVHEFRVDVGRAGRNFQPRPSFGDAGFN